MVCASLVIAYRNFLLSDYNHGVSSPNPNRRCSSLIDGFERVLYRQKTAHKSPFLFHILQFPRAKANVRTDLVQPSLWGEDGNEPIKTRTASSRHVEEPL